MNANEVKTFMNRIKSHYQEFIIDDFKFNEWYKELKNYDYADINDKFEKHLRDETYGNQYPKLYFLTKYLTPIDKKSEIKHYSVLCQQCNKSISLEEYDKHYDKCCLSKTIVKDMKKYFDLYVDYDVLYNMSNDEFIETKRRYLKKMLESSISKQRKEIIEKCLKTDVEIQLNLMERNKKC